METAPDPLLLSLLAARNRNALRELRFRYGPTAYAAAYALGADPEQAEAAVSEAFGRAWVSAAERVAAGTRSGVASWIGELVGEAARQLRSA